MALVTDKTTVTYVMADRETDKFDVWEGCDR